MAQLYKWLFDATAAGGDNAFYPEHARWISTGGAGTIGGVSGYLVDRWAPVVGRWVAHSAGTWESQAALVLGGFIPQSLTATDEGHAVPYALRIGWTNETTSYQIYVEVDKLVSGTWTADHNSTMTAGSVQEATALTMTAGAHYRARARYTNAGVNGDWSAYVFHIMPT